MLINLNPILNSLHSSLQRAIFAFKVKKKRKKKSLDFLPLFILIFLLLLEGMSPIQDIPSAQADRRGKMNTACQLQLQDHMSVQELSKMLHGNCTTGPGESTGIQASK